MEEIRAIALAYYHNFSNNEKHDAYAAFKQIDTNGDGTITIDEYEEIFGTQDRLSFQEVDTNGDGKIDFEEFITLYYFVNYGMVLCDGDGCKVKFLKGIYFTCLECFHLNKTTTFDLCPSCYRYRNFVHEHNNFLDSHLLLRCKAAHAQDGANSREGDDQADESWADESNSREAGRQADESGAHEPNYLQLYQVKSSVSKREVVMKVFNSVNAGFNIGQAVIGAASACSIM